MGIFKNLLQDFSKYSNQCDGAFATKIWLKASDWKVCEWGLSNQTAEQALNAFILLVEMVAIYHLRFKGQVFAMRSIGPSQIPLDPPSGPTRCHGSKRKRQVIDPCLASLITGRYGFATFLPMNEQTSDNFTASVTTEMAATTSGPFSH